MMQASARRFEAFHDLESWADNNEFHVAAAVTCMGFWQAQGRVPTRSSTTIARTSSCGPSVGG